MGVQNIDMKKKRLLRTLLRSLASGLLVAVAVTLLPELAEACPTCKDGLNTPAQQRMAVGFFYSILFMMSMPFAILGTFGTFAYLSFRKARLEQAESVREES